MKKILVVALTLALLTIMTVPAAASGGPGGKGGGGNGNSPANPVAAPQTGAVTGSGTAAQVGAPDLPGSGSGTAAKVGEDNGNESGVFSMVGSIVEVDPAAYTVSVAVVAGNKLAQSTVGQTITLQATHATRFLLSYQAGYSLYGSASPEIAIEDLAIGQNVSVNGELEDGEWVASRITVAPQLFLYQNQYNK